MSSLFLQPPDPPKCSVCGALIEDPLFDHTGRCEQCWTVSEREGSSDTRQREIDWLHGLHR